jgi:hypothetical protein
MIRREIKMYLCKSCNNVDVSRPGDLCPECRSAKYEDDHSGEELTELEKEKLKRDEEDAYRQLWDEYRVLTHDMGRSLSGECLKIHKRLFGDLPRNEK